MHSDEEGASARNPPHVVRPKPEQALSGPAWQGAGERSCTAGSRTLHVRVPVPLLRFDSVGHVHVTVPLELTVCTEPLKDAGGRPVEESTPAALPLITCQQTRPAPPCPEIQVSKQHQPEGPIEYAGQRIARPMLAFYDA